MTERMGSIDPGEIVQAASAIKDQVADAIQQASERLELERRMRENPWVVLGIAAGAGFVLGGGLWPAIRPLVRAAARTALSPSNLLAAAAAVGALRVTGGGAEDSDVPSPMSH